MESAQTKTLSPSDFARIIGVSESSIRRWVDDGKINVMRTAGGHRRILLSEALRFVRENEVKVLRPELLGLPDLTGIDTTEGLTEDRLFSALTGERPSAARGAIINAFVSGTPLAEIYDGPISGALNRLGQLWRHGEEGIYIEHVATTICIEAVNQIRMLLPPAETSARAALGGALEGDPYLLPSLMAASICANAGYRDVNLGADTPANAFLAAANSIQPDLVWITITGHFTAREVDTFVKTLVVPLVDGGFDVVAGGQTAAAHSTRWPSSVTLLGSMRAFDDYIRDKKKMVTQ